MKIQAVVPLMLFTLGVLTAPRPAISAPAAAPYVVPEGKPVNKVTRSEEEWKKRLSREQFRILRLKGTETAFTGKYWNHHARGTYSCAACRLELFRSETQYESGTGWPSFWAPIASSHVVIGGDRSLGMERDEVLCARCGGHLGHVFDDGPEPTHLRYCMNSAALTFAPAK